MTHVPSPHFRLFAAVLLLSACIVAFAPPARAQVAAAGAIVGTVTDATGAVVPAGAAAGSTPPAKPEVEVRITGKEAPAPATPASPGTEPTTPPEPAGPSKVVGAPGTLPPRPILPPPASRP